jgi:hypothetical protein
VTPLEEIAAELGQHEVIGPGLLHRIISEMQRRMILLISAGRCPGRPAQTLDLIDASARQPQTPLLLSRPASPPLLMFRRSSGRGPHIETLSTMRRCKFDFAWLRRSTEMVDFETAKALGHRRNLERYHSLLRTEPTAYERKYILQRIALETAELEAIEQLRSGDLDHFVLRGISGRRHSSRSAT